MLFFVASLHCLTFPGVRDCPLPFSLCRNNREDGGNEGMEGRREVVKAQKLAEHKVHV